MSVSSGQPLMPWLDATRDSLWQAHRLDRLPHALLFAGPRGVGKRLLVRCLAQSLLCTNPTEQGNACHRCRECHLFSTGTHPDFHAIGPDDAGKSREIKVEVIRELVRSESLTSNRGSYKIVALAPAEAMNTAAANALLKTLEEPSSGTLLCLVAENPGDLPATIRSRCQIQRIPVPSRTEALSWLSPRLADFLNPRLLLDLSRGAPLRALEIADQFMLERRLTRFEGFRSIAVGDVDPVAEAATWNADDPGILLDWFAGWLSDLLRLAVGMDRGLINSDQQRVLSVLLTRLDRVACHRLLQRVFDIRSAATGNVNMQLQIESLLIEWARVARRGR